jgi:long-subunit fatty acid transport protein
MLGALTLLATPAHANPLDAFGFGARGLSLSGAMTANATDFSANYYNPAGLAAENDLRIEMGYIYVEPSLQVNDADMDVDRNYGVQGGVVLPGRVFDRNVSFSFGLHVPAERISRIRALPQRQPRWVLYDNRPQRLVITTSLAFEIIDVLYIGGGLTYLSDTGGVMKMEGLADISEADQTAFFSGVDVDLASVRYASAGLLYTPGDWRFGFAFRDEFYLGLDLGVDVGGNIAAFLPDLPPAVEGASFVLVTQSTNLFSPRQLAWGVTYESEQWMATLDLTWAQWSRFPAPAAEIEIDIDLGTLNFEIPPSDQPLDPGFRNIVIPRVAAEIHAIDQRQFGLTLRGGGYVEPTPAVGQPEELNYVDTVKLGVSTGVGLRFSEFSEVFPRPILFDIGAVYVRLPRRDYQKNDAADPVGDYYADGHFLGFATSLSFLF